MRQRRRRRRKTYVLQSLWVVVALVAIVGLIIGYTLGSEENEDHTSPSANATGKPLDSTKKPTVEPTSEATLAPTSVPLLSITPTLAPTITLEPTVIPTITPTKSPFEQTVGVGTNDGEAEETPKMVALTFDDGPYPPVTERIVQTLKENGAKGTFFMMGNRMDQYRSSVELAYEGGNQIASHTFSHKDLTKLSLKDMKYEIDQANECINNVVPVGETYLRPPYGNKNEIMKQNVGVPMIFWSIDTLDWSSRDGQSVYQEIMKNVKDGDIILMHDLYPSTADAMELVVPKLIKEGYQLVTVKELLEAKGIDILDGNVYYNGRK